MEKVWIFLFFAVLPACYFCYKPVVVMHGIFSSNKDMEDLVDLIKTAHPGTDVTNIDGFDDLESLATMWTQTDQIYDKMKPVITGSEPVILICFSQGGLLCRSILEKYQHNVSTFISLSSPQAGQYGDTDYLKFLFPDFLKGNIYEFFYTSAGQEFSIGNYWNDPYHQDKYFADNNFLPKLNNASQEYKKNFLRLEQLVLIGGPDDGVITPWQSSQFGFYQKNSDEVLPYTSRYYYEEDTFGLKTLDVAGKIAVHTVSGVQHKHWHGNKTVFDSCVKPYLT